MPMMVPPGQAVTVAVNPNQVTAAGPAAQPRQAAPAPPPVSPFKQEIAPDVVLMPHLQEPQQGDEQ